MVEKNRPAINCSAVRVAFVTRRNLTAVPAMLQKYHCIEGGELRGVFARLTLSSSPIGRWLVL